MGPPEHDWYRAWVLAHCHSFGITGPDQIAVFASWRGAMIGLGATAADLAECTRLVLMDERTPEWPREHLAAVKRHLGRLHDARARKAEQAARDADRRGYCSLCGNAGWVVVPLPADVQGGTWQPHHRNHLGEPVYRTCAVTCPCEDGRRQAAGAAAHADRPSGKSPLTLGQYEARVNPAWREHVAERDDARRELARAHTIAHEADRLGKLPNIRKLLAGVGTPAGGGA